MKAIFPKEVWKMTRPFIVFSQASIVVYSNLFRGSPELEENRKEEAMHRRTCATGIVSVWIRMLAKGTLTIHDTSVDACWKNGVNRQKSWLQGLEGWRLCVCHKAK